MMGLLPDWRIQKETTSLNERMGCNTVGSSTVDFGEEIV